MKNLVKGSFNTYAIMIYGSEKRFPNSKKYLENIFDKFYWEFNPETPLIFKPIFNGSNMLCKIILMTNNSDIIAKNAIDLTSKLKNLKLFDDVELKYQEMHASNLE